MTLVQLPNEQDFLPMNIDLSLFKEDKRIEDVVFGWYGETYLGIKIK